MYDKEIEGLEAVAEWIMPAVIANLLVDGSISKDSTDRDVLDAVAVHVENNIASYDVTFVGNGFEDDIKTAIENNQSNVAVVLTGILIERMTNEFFHEVLLYEHNLSKREYDSCIRGASIKDKLTWLYKITTSKSIEDNFVDDVCKICTKRNNIAHYKPKVRNMDDEWDLAEIYDTNIDLSILLPLVARLQSIFDEHTNHIFPEKRIGLEMMERIKKNKDVLQSR